jgi:hypothetical protein
MFSRYLVAIALLTYSCVSLALDADSIGKLYSVSDNIEKATNYKSVVESLYQQIRPRANITNKSLSQKQVDIKVRQYITDKYAPALVMNYQHIYSQLRGNGGEFSDCGNVTPIKSGEDVLKALCLSGNNGHIKVSYMTNGYSQGWKTSAIFVFNAVNNAFQLSAIELQLKDGVKAYVEGI